MAYTNQKAVSSYILLRVKPKLPGAKTGSPRFLDVTRGMDSGFSLCAAPAFCCGPGISRDRQVYAHPMSRWEAARLKDEVGEFPEAQEEE